MTSLSHPFLKSPQTIDIPKEHINDVEEIFSWIKSQPRFPNLTKNHAYLFLHACLWDHTATKKALQKYVQIRANSPDVFDNRDISQPGMQYVFNMTHMVEVPPTTPEGYKVLFYRLADTDPSKMNFGDAVKGFCMFNDVRISEDGIVNGYVVVFDMKGLRLGHLARVQLGPLRTFMSYIQEAHPVRLKKIYIVHTASFINQIMAIIKPLIKSELLNLLQFTPNGPLDIFSEDILPEDYGGKLGSLADYHKIQRAQMENEYKDWLIDSSRLKEIPKEKPIKPDRLKTIQQPPVKSFQALEID